MRKSRLADIDRPMTQSDPNREYHRAIREDIKRHRERQTLTGQDPHKNPARPWKVRDADKPPAPPTPAFEWELDGHNLVRVLRQLRALPGSLDERPEHRGRRFRLRITEQCGGPEGLTLAAGCELDCLAETAFSLHGLRGAIYEEYQEGG